MTIPPTPIEEAVGRLEERLRLTERLGANAEIGFLASDLRLILSFLRSQRGEGLSLPGPRPDDLCADAQERSPKEDKHAAAVEYLTYAIARDLEAAIASLGYPVGCGLAPHPDTCRLAASRIIEKIGSAALSILAERSSPPHARSDVDHDGGEGGR